MDVGLVKRLIPKYFLHRIIISGMITRTLFALVIIFLVLSIFIPELLAITGSFIIGTVAMYNNDLQREVERINYDVQRAQIINEFQNMLISITHAFLGIRKNYEDYFAEVEGADKKFNRYVNIPYIAYIPKFEAYEIRQLVSKLSFTGALISPNEARGIENKPNEVKGKSITILSQHLIAIEGICEMWRLRNKLYHECYKVPSTKDPSKLEFEFRDMNDVHQFMNYVHLTDRCLVLTDETILVCQMGLNYFIPEAAGLLLDQAKSICPIYQIGALNLKGFILEELDNEELDNLLGINERIARKKGFIID